MPIEQAKLPPAPEGFKRAVAFIDGFNLYHAIDDMGKDHLKWVNLVKLSGCFLKENWHLARVYLFTSYTTWDPDKQARHQQFVQAQRAKGVRVIEGSFRWKDAKCKASCKEDFKIPVEKQTDVNIALTILDDALHGRYECAVLISADSDLAPAIKLVKRYHPGKLFRIVTPPGRDVCWELARANGDKNPRWKMVRDWYPTMTAAQLEDCLLSEEVTSDVGEVKAVMPAKYKPPQ